jgi:hypothetical protein
VFAVILTAGAANSTAPIAFDPMTHLSEERIAEIREHGMRLADFRIGMEFWMSGTRWRCTDIGTRLVIAIQLVYDDDPGWYKGPPYAIPQSTIEPHDFPDCSLDRYGGNSYNFSDEVVELLKTSGNYGRAEWHLGAPEALKRMRILRDEGRAARLQVPPMTPAQIEAEAAYAEKIYKELVLDPTPETKRKISEAIKLRRPSRSQSL